MKYMANEINNIFTNEVNKFIAKGYTFNCNTMSGSQGEIAKVDLISPDKKQLVRINIDSDKDKDWRDTLVITTKLYNAKDERVNVQCVNRHNTLWTDHGTEYSKITLYAIDRWRGGRIFTDSLSDIEAIDNLRQKRYKVRNSIWNEEDSVRYTSDKVKKMVLPFVQRQYRCKTYQVNDIDYVHKQYNTKSKKTTYTVKAKDHYFELG